MPRAVKPKPGPIPSCIVCRRRPADGHDDYCTPERRAAAAKPPRDEPAPVRVVGTFNPPVEFANQATTPEEQRRQAMPAVAARRAAAREEENMTTNALAAAAQAVGLPEPGTQKACDTCRQWHPFDHYRGPHGRTEANCKACRAEKMRLAREAKKAPTGVTLEAVPTKTYPLPVLADLLPEPDGGLTADLEHWRRARERALSEAKEAEQRIAEIEAILAMEPDAIAAHLERARRAVALAEAALREKTNAA